MQVGNSALILICFPFLPTAEIGSPLRWGSLRRSFTSSSLGAFLEAEQHPHPAPYSHQVHMADLTTGSIWL